MNRQRNTEVAWQKHYRGSHNLDINKFENLETLRRHLCPWLAPDFELNGDWGYYLTKKSPIEEFKHLTAYWQATSDPLMFRRTHHDKMLDEYRSKFESIF